MRAVRSQTLTFRVTGDLPDVAHVVKELLVAAEVLSQSVDDLTVQASGLRRLDEFRPRPVANVDLPEQPTGE